NRPKAREAHRGYNGGEQVNHSRSLGVGAIGMIARPRTSTTTRDQPRVFAKRRFEAWKAKLVCSPDILGGEPVFPGSRLAVRHVGGMLLRGASLKEIHEDYPYLSGEDIAFAKLYMEASSRVGRPR